MTLLFLLGGGILLSGLLGAFNVQIIPNFVFAGFSVNWFTAICFVGILYIVIRYSSTAFKKYTVCGVLIVAGLFCGIDLYKNLTAQSYIRGSINIENTFSMESFNYSSTGVTFYHDLYDNTETWNYDIDLKPVNDFNGQRNTYQLVINDYIIFGTVVNAGSINADFNMDFYNTSGDMICSAEMKVKIAFYSNKTSLSLVVVGNQAASFLEQYFADNGIRLFVNEIKGGN